MENGLNPYNVSIPSDPELRIDSDSGDYRDEESYGSPGPAATIEFLNRPEVQDALGVSINYTFFTHKVFHWFEQSE